MPMRTPLAWFAIGSAALCVTVAQEDTSETSGAIECHAAWGPVKSSVYPLVRARDGVEEQIGSGPRTLTQSHPVTSFRALLPPAASPAPTGGEGGSGVARGKGHGGDHPVTDETTDATPELERVWEIDVAHVLPFLKQLHPGATERMRFGRIPADLAKIMRDQGSDPAEWSPKSVEGGRATLISRTDAELAVLLRVHMEFELVPDEVFLMPSQFEGTLIWDRVAHKPKSFHLALPPRDTNYDLSAYHAIDIGYLPLMQVATDKAVRSGAEADAARERLRRSFYPSARIEWRSLEEGLARAKKSGRRLHVVQLFGTLDDESC